MTSLCNLLNCSDAESIRYAVRGLANLARGAGRISLCSQPGVLAKLQACSDRIQLPCLAFTFHAQVLLESPDEECRRHAGRALKTLAMPSSGGYTPPGYHTVVTRSLVPAHWAFLSSLKLTRFFRPSSENFGNIDRAILPRCKRVCPQAFRRAHPLWNHPSGIFQVEISGKICRSCLVLAELKIRSCVQRTATCAGGQREFVIPPRHVV